MQLQIQTPVKKYDLDSTKNLNHMLLIPELAMDENGGLANVHLDHSVLDFLKASYILVWGLRYKAKKDQNQLCGEDVPNVP